MQLLLISSGMYGELAALATATFWTITALAFELASKKVGSLAVNLFRMVFALIFLSLFNYFNRGFLFPTDASLFSWKWLALSGLVGFVLGDYFLFKAYQLINSRIAMLVMTLVPPITAVSGWLLLGEVLKPIEIAGMVLTMGGISLAIVSRKQGKGKLRLSYPLKGILFALIGAIGQAIGLVLSKYGMQEYDAFASTQIRIIAGLIGFVVIIAVLGKFSLVKTTLRNKAGMRGITIGSIFGPFLGVSFSLIAVQYTTTGVASTIMAIVPILLILPSIILFKQKIGWLEIVGAFVSVGGVALLFI